MIQAHGGALPGLDILDFSANLNPLGMPETVRSAVLESASGWGHYPDPECSKLRNSISQAEGVPIERIVCGNGAADLIYRIVHAFRPGQAVVCAPTFGEYAKALKETDCCVREHMLRENSDFRVAEDILPELSGADIVFLCNPNNPTGQLIDPDLLRDAAEECRKHRTLLVCDESFLGFAVNGSTYSLKRWLNEQCIVLSAFTKLYAIPGLRVGYCLCGSTEIANKIADTGQYWSVSSPAQAAGNAAARDPGYALRTAEYVSLERKYLTSELTALGIKVCSSAANFLLMRAFAGLDDRLLRKGILIRSCTSFTGLTDSHFRIAVRTREENQRLTEAVRRVMNG